MPDVQVAYNNLFKTESIVGLFSQLRTPRQKFANFWGMKPGREGNRRARGMAIGYDLKDATRKMASVRAPRTGPGMAEPQVVGHVSAQALRIYEELHIDENSIAHSRPLGGNVGEIDRSGAVYVTEQRASEMERMMNTVEFAVSRMCTRGSFQLKRDGDDWLPVDSGGHLTVDFQVPAGNKDQLDMTGGGDIIGASWVTDTTDILGDFMQINDADENLSGYGTRHAFCRSSLVSDLMDNDSLQEAAGTANSPFTIFTEEGEQLPDGTPVPTTNFMIRFQGLPHILFHVVDDLIQIEGTDTATIEADHIALLPDPSPQIAFWTDGSEFVRDNDIAPSIERFGFHGWSQPTTKPAGFGEQMLIIGLPCLVVPKTIKYADITP